jgi:hypothetical protein
MKLNKRLKFAYDLVNYKFYIFDQLLNYYYQYTSNNKYIMLEDILSDYDTEKISNLKLEFISLDELIINILDNQQIMKLIGYNFEIWGKYSQDDLIVNCYKINYQNTIYTLYSDKYDLVDNTIDLDWPHELLEQLNNIYTLEKIEDKFWL